MAAYALTVTLGDAVGQKLAGSPLRVVRGVANITNYNQTTVPEATDITGRFRGNPTVVCSGVSNGTTKQLVRWSPADLGFRCYVPTTGAETATDVDVGSVDFLAFGVAP
jgi:hypothetical protein